MYDTCIYFQAEILNGREKESTQRGRERKGEKSCLSRFHVAPAVGALRVSCAVWCHQTSQAARYVQRVYHKCIRDRKCAEGMKRHKEIASQQEKHGQIHPLYGPLLRAAAHRQ